MTIQCCVCKKILIDGHWCENTPGEKDYTHTYCPVCGAEMLIQAGIDPTRVFPEYQAA